MEVVSTVTPKEYVERPEAKLEEPINDASSLPGRRRKASFFAGLEEAFRVDLARRPCVKDLLDSYIGAMERDVDGDVDGDYYANSTCHNEDDKEELEADIRVNRLWGENKTLVPGSTVTAARIKRMYDKKSDDNYDRNRGGGAAADCCSDDDRPGA